MLIRTATAGVTGEITVYAVAFLGIVMHYAASARRDAAPLSLGAFARHLAPPELLASRWTRLDMLYYVSDKLVMALVFPSVAGMVVLASRVSQATFGAMLGSPPAVPLTIASLLAFLVCGLMARDFASFGVHLMQHRVPLLWEFHKVHHAPESLIPPTGHRLHPVDQFLGMAAEVPLLGIVIGLFAWLTQQDLPQLILYSVGFYTLVNVVTFAPLRHSHIDLRFGRLERVLLTPAHHRLHHSVEPSHWDKNFAALFPFWDRMFATLHEPPPRETYRLGLPGGASTRYDTLLACYVEPFRQAAHGLKTLGVRHMLRAHPVANHKPPVPRWTSDAAPALPQQSP